MKLKEVLKGQFTVENTSCIQDLISILLSNKYIVKNIL